MNPDLLKNSFSTKVSNQEKIVTVTPEKVAYSEEDLYKKLDVKALIRVKANLFPAKEKLSEHGWHTDYAYSNKTALLYINDTDGYTKFEDGTKVDSVKNRVLIFDSNRKHLSTNCTKDWSRLNININYF